MKKLVIIGTGGFAREVYWHAQNSLGYGNEYIFKCFVEGNVPIDENRIKTLPDVFEGSILEYKVQEDDVFTIAIANSEVKKFIASYVTQKGGNFINLIHKTTMISPLSKVGKGIILCPFTSVSCNVHIGNYVMLNSYSSIGHDAIIGDYSSIMGHVDITGNVVVGESTYWGSGSRALPHSKIGDHSVVGAGSVVLKRIKSGITVFGNPAMPI